MNELLSVLLTPMCWVQNYPYSVEWDLELNKRMAEDRFVRRSDCTAMIGHHTVWIANHPYASFTNQELSVRPSRMTILKAHRKLLADFLTTPPK